MPRLTWEIDAADRSILDSLTSIEQAANRAAAAVKQIGAGAAGGPRAGSSLAGGVLQATQSQAGLTRMGAQVDSLLHKLQQLGQTQPEVRVNAQFLGVVTDIQRLHVQLTALAAQPYSVAVHLRTAELRADLAQAQRDLAALQRANPTITLHVNVAATQTALTRTGTQVDGLQRQLQRLSAAHPEIRATANFQQAMQQATQLQTRLAELQRQPVTIQTRIDLEQAQAQVAQLQRSTAQLRGEFASTGRAAQQHGSALSSFFTMALSAATGFLAANVFQQIASGIADIGTGTVTAAADMERTRAAFTTLTGSAERANALIAAMQREANISPFQLDSFRRAGQLLLGMGTAADQVVPRLHEVSNVVAAVGGSNEQFDRISLALSQIQAKGKVSAEEINQLAENGVPGWDILARALGKTRGEVLDLAEQSRISSEVFQQAFSQFANSPQIAQAAERQSHTFSGLLSTIHDIGYALEYSFGTPLIQTIEPTLERIVRGLQDPQVTATLAQWGQAAGNFVNGLIQAAQVAAQVGGEILGALKPVTDLLGDLFGMPDGPQAPDPPKPPDFSGATDGAAQFNATVANGNAQMLRIRDQVAQMERDQREANRAAADEQVTFQHTSDTIRDNIRLLQEKYDLENKTADRAELVAKIAKDELLARDVYSPQGQAAAKRLVEERAQLRRMDRQAQFDHDKSILESDLRTNEGKAQNARDTLAKNQRDTQEAVDKLREGDTGGPGGLKVRTPDGRTYQGNSQDRADLAAFQKGLADSTTQGQTWAQTIRASIDGVIAKLRELGGAPGAVIGALLDDWKLLTGAFDGIGTHTGTIIAAVDRLATTLGARDGLEGVFIALRFEFLRLLASLATVAPTILSRLGNNFGELGDAITQTIDVIRAAAATQQLLGDRTPANEQAAADAYAQIAKDREAADARHAQFVKDDAQTQGTFQDRIAAINKDIDARQAAAFREADARRGVPGPDLGMRPDYTQPTTYPQYGPGYNGPYTGAAPNAYPQYGPGYNGSYTLPPQQPDAGMNVNLTGQITVDEQGLLRVANMQITGKRLAKVLGDYASR